jgi:proline dehydrogenase
VFQRLSRAVLLALGRNTLVASWTRRAGERNPHGFVGRFVGGTTVTEALAVARELKSRGFDYTLNHLGEHVSSPASAQTASQDYLTFIDAAAAAGQESALSIKLSQIGLEVDRALCIENLRRILERSREHQGFVRIDMEGSGTVDDTFTVFETMWRENFRNVGVVLQAYLHRTEDDLARAVSLGATVRLCKGAYDEPAEVAFRTKNDINAAFLRLMRALLLEGRSPTIATHDSRLVEATCAFASAQRLARDDFEFEMLYGVRRDLQQMLLERCYSVRIYVPFGTDWYPYFMRRLAERPGNVRLVVHSLLGDILGRRA